MSAAPLGFAYLWIVFGVTYAIKASQTGVQPYYISGLLNSAEDTVPEFVLRWVLWGSVPVVLFVTVRRRLSTCWAWTLLVVWWLAIGTGVDPRVFDGPAPSDALQFAHYAASGLVLLVASLVLLQIRRWLGWFWILVTVAYCSTFLLSRYSDDIDIPAEVYITTEYVLYLTTGVAVLLVPATSPRPPPPLEGVEVRPGVNVLARERALERMHR